MFKVFWKKPLMKWKILGHVWQYLNLSVRVENEIKKGMKLEKMKRNRGNEEGSRKYSFLPPT